jgi:zinc and cadmium transporter
MTALQLIVLVTAGAGLSSVLIAASLSLGVLAKLVDRMVSISVGILLATALLHSLPEAFEMPGVDAHVLFGVLLQDCWASFYLRK